ncbi:MAG TPA: phosphosulfolactate synthase [Mycobacteriales bacterium]|nr:phosphosulfolactate synthase [Mycobacteriales bacterium]
MSTIVNVAPSFLTLPGRTAKPRCTGITHVLDNGLPVSTAEALLGVCADHVDVWKLGWGTAYLDPGLPAKLALLAGAGVLACAGGTLLEVAWQQDAVEPFLDWAQEVGFPCVEVSRGVADMPLAAKQALVARAAERFTVLAEVGAKDPAAVVDPHAWGVEAAGDRASGATWVVTEGRESGTIGLFAPDGSVRGDVVDAVVAAVGIGTTVFEAPRKEQQAWLVRRFGADVNLANIAPADVLGVEALRLGLRADTFSGSPRHSAARGPG